MSANEIFVFLLFFGVCSMLMAGFPVAFSLAGVALIFASLGSLFGAFDISYLGFFSEPHIRHHDKRSTDRRAAIRLHGGHAGTF